MTLQREPSFIRRISEDAMLLDRERDDVRHQAHQRTHWTWTIIICIIVSILIQIITPRLSILYQDITCRVDFLTPLCNNADKAASNPSDTKANNRKYLPQEERHQIIHLEEPIPIEEWTSSDQEKWGVIRQPLCEDKPKDPALEREALAALLQARSNRQGGNQKKAGHIIEHALAMLPDHPDILTEYGIHLETQNNLLEADGYFSRALSYNPSHSEALIRRSRTQPIVTEMDEKMLKEISRKRDIFVSLPRCATIRRAMRESYFSHIYHTVSIEGNTLSLGETRSILESGMVVSGKSIREHNEVLGMDSALRFLNSTLLHVADITLDDLLEMHRRVLGHAQPLDAGRLRNTQVYVGRFTPVAPQYVTEQMFDLVDWLNDPKTMKMDAVERAAIAHYKLVVVHPFVDGNGRTARLLLNLILMKAGFPPVILPVETRAEYYATLHTANLGDLRPFVRYVARHVEKALLSYINLVSTCPNGECPAPQQELSSNSLDETVVH